MVNIGKLDIGRSIHLIHLAKKNETHELSKHCDEAAVRCFGPTAFFVGLTATMIGQSELILA